MPLSFRIPRRFHPGYSLLGRALRRLASDRRQAEAYFILTLTAVGLALLLAQYLTWALLQPTLSVAPSGTTALIFWSVQIAGLLLFMVTCVLGVQPPAVVTCEAGGLRMRQGRCRAFVPYGAIESAEAISPTRFHRHERRYAATHVFATHLTHELLLLRTARGPVVLGLAPEDQAALREHLSRVTHEASRRASDLLETRPS